MTAYAFDVNETLLDLSVLDGPFRTHLGSAALRATWFARMLQLSFVGAITGAYVDFTTAQRAALDMVAAGAGRPLGEDAHDAIVGGMRRLPAHPDVGDALAALRAGGHRLFALTNSPADVLADQLTFAGLRSAFDGELSADAVRAAKPAAPPYLHAADRAGVDPGELVLVAAHAWDVSGALAAGLRAVFVSRGGEVPSPLGTQPERVVGDLTELADADR